MQAASAFRAVGAHLSAQDQLLGVVQSNQEQLESSVEALNKKLDTVQAAAATATQLATAAHYRQDGAAADSIDNGADSDDEDERPLSAVVAEKVTKRPSGKEKKREKRANGKEKKSPEHEKEKKPPKSEKEKQPPKSEKGTEGVKRKAPARYPALGCSRFLEQEVRKIQKQRVDEEAKWSKLLQTTDESEKVVQSFASMLQNMGCEATPEKMVMPAEVTVMVDFDGRP